MNAKAEFVLKRIRIELEDSVEPHFWPEDELLMYLDEAQIQFCRDVPIRDSRTPEICELSYRAGDYEIPYHESILRILTAIRQDSSGGLHKVNLTSQENATALFSTRRTDYGTSIDNTRQLTRASDDFDLFIDYDAEFIRFSSPAETAGTILLQVERLPKKELEECDDIVEVRRENIPALIAWSAYRGWSKEDAETFDDKAAAKQLALFDRYVSKAVIEYKRRHTQPGTVHYGFP